MEVKDIDKYFSYDILGREYDYYKDRKALQEELDFFEETYL